MIHKWDGKSRLCSSWNGASFSLNWDGSCELMKSVIGNPVFFEFIFSNFDLHVYVIGV